MIPLGFRLTLNGGREAIVRLIITAMGVTIGVCLLLFLLAGFNGLHAQDVHWGWLATSSHNLKPSVSEATTDPLWWQVTGDTFNGQNITRVDVAPTGPNSPIPPGIPKIPAAGQYYASPELAHLIASNIPSRLGDRFRGVMVGTISSNGLTNPKALIAVVGDTPSQLANGRAEQVKSIETAPRQHGLSDFLKIVLIVGAVGLLFPVLIFVGAATRLSAARREQRFAALRLIGATPRQVNVIASTEAAIAAIIGVILGFGLFWLLRPIVAAIPLTGEPFFTSDLSLTPVEITAIILGVPLASSMSAMVALRRVQISPLGVSRRVTPKPQRAWRVIPLLIGMAIVGFSASYAQHHNVNQTLALMEVVGSFVLTMIGLVTAGPWLTQVLSLLIAKNSRRVPSLIASRRLSDNPKVAFRAVSGLVLAVFVASVFSGLAATVLATVASHSGPLPSTAIATLFNTPASDGLSASIAQSIETKLGSISGVRQVVPIYAAPASLAFPFIQQRSDAPESQSMSLTGLIACPSLPGLGLGKCEEPSGFTQIRTAVVTGGNASNVLWSNAKTGSLDISHLPMQAVIVTSNTNATEQVRTAIEVASPFTGVVATQAELASFKLSTLHRLQQMADVGILITLIIAGCSLAVAVAGGLIERKRPFSLLRLTGMPFKDLRKVVVYEAAVPLIAVAMLSAATGLVFAYLFIRSVINTSYKMPSLDYYAIVGAGIVFALAIVASTLPLLSRLTEPDNARFE